MAPIRQTNFRAGELSPYLWGRTDLPVFGQGLRTCRNFFITRHGAAVSRPGTTYVGPAKTPEAPSLGPDRDTGQVRLVRFDAGDGGYDAYAMVFGNQYLRFVTQGGYVLDPATGDPYEVPGGTPYTYAELWDLQFAQSGDVIIITHPNHAPKKLTRLGHADWTLENVRFKAYSPFASDPGSNPKQPTTGFVVDSTSVGAPDADHPDREWQWKWTALVRDNDSGELYETLAEDVVEEMNGDDYDGTAAPLLNDKFPIYLDRTVRLARAETAGLLSTPDGFDTYTVEEFLLYRGRGGLFGFVGSTKGREFIDVGDEPNYAIQPPQGTEPFDFVGNPFAVTFFQQRLCFGGGPVQFGGDLWTSKAGDFQNWDSRLYYDTSGEALHFRLAARRKEKMRSFAVLGRLLAFTNASVWSIGGVQGSPLDFDSVDMRVEDEVGATNLPPLVVDGSAIYARAKGRGVRALVPTGQEGPFQGADISQVAQHLFTGKGLDLIDWTYAEDPYGIVWAVRGDGQLLSLTYMKDGPAWAHHDTDGVVESVCAIPDADEDAVYLVVVRETANGKRRYIERMTSRVQRGGAEADAVPSISVPPDNICVDCALEYFGVAGISTVTGLDHLEGKQVWVLVQGLDPFGPFTVTGGSIDLGATLESNITTVMGPRLVLHVGLPYTCDLETLDVAGGGARLRQKSVSWAGLEVIGSRGIKAGMSFDKLDEWQQRSLDDGYSPVSNATALVYMPVPSTPDKAARLCLRQERPLPVTVVGMTREVDIGG